MFAKGKLWDEWQIDFRFGTLVFIPSGHLLEVADSLRDHYDPRAANGCVAHITLTQPLTKAPSQNDLGKIASIIGSHGTFDVKVGPATASPNQRMVWMDVEPKDKVLQLRDKLHKTGLFRTGELQLTKGFIPHLTISDDQRQPEQVSRILEILNEKFKPQDVPFDRVSWIVPDENFVFGPQQHFDLVPSEPNPLPS